MPAAGRVSPGASLSDILSTLNHRQRELIEDLDTEQREHARLLLMLESKRARLTRTVYLAMQEGIPVRLIADRLKVTSSRVYQMRDEVEKQIGKSK